MTAQQPRSNRLELCQTVKMMSTQRLLGLAVTVSALALTALPLPAQTHEEAAALTSAQRERIIRETLSAVEKRYVFPEVAKRMIRSIRQRKARGAYRQITSRTELADSLTAHLQEASRDRHMAVFYAPRDTSGGPEPASGARDPQERERLNFGFFRAERMAGNVGYIDLRTFMGGSGADSAAAAAMNFLARTDALIIDLRENGGGSAPMVARLVSYFLPDTVLLLNAAYDRSGARVEETRTSRELLARRYGTERPLFILTSGKTFSAAEEFAYNLKHLDRATIVGETTGGGANPNMLVRVAEDFEVSVAIMQVRSPITGGGNWEGTGVGPDLPTSAEDALRTAHAAALRRLIERTESPSRAAGLDAALRSVLHD